MSICDRPDKRKPYACRKKDDCKRRKGLELLFEHAMDISGIPGEFKNQLKFIIEECPQAAPI
jgi:hypothetical protein